jgi:hypothetical protein
MALRYRLATVSQWHCTKRNCRTAKAYTTLRRMRTAAPSAISAEIGGSTRFLVTAVQAPQQPGTDGHARARDAGHETEALHDADEDGIHQIAEKDVRDVLTDTENNPFQHIDVRGRGQLTVDAASVPGARS